MVCDHPLPSPQFLSPPGTKITYGLRARELFDGPFQAKPNRMAKCRQCTESGREETPRKIWRAAQPGGMQRKLAKKKQSGLKRGGLIIVSPPRWENASPQAQALGSWKAGANAGQYQIMPRAGEKFRGLGCRDHRPRVNTPMKSRRHIRSLKWQPVIPTGWAANWPRSHRFFRSTRTREKPGHESPGETRTSTRRAALAASATLRMARPLCWAPHHGTKSVRQIAGGQSTRWGMVSFSPIRRHRIGCFAARKSPNSFFSIRTSGIFTVLNCFRLRRRTKWGCARVSRWEARNARAWRGGRCENRLLRSGGPYHRPSPPGPGFRLPFLSSPDGVK